MPISDQATGPEASKRIDARLRELGDWRGETLTRMRTLILAALPGVEEQWKWGIPVWSHAGILCTGETYKAVVKLTFAKGASLPDPKRLFNASLGGATRRAIDLREGDTVNASAFKALIKAAAALNATKPARPSKREKPAVAAKPARRKAATGTKHIPRGR